MKHNRVHVGRTYGEDYIKKKIQQAREEAETAQKAIKWLESRIYLVDRWVVIS